MATWKIARRQGTCSGCERPFEDGERHASQLRIDEEELARVDLCAACWKAALEQGQAPAGPSLIHWFTRHQVEARKTVQLDLPSLERLFLDLEGREERKVRELRYVICLLLMRKRRVKLERILRGPEGESFLVRRPRHDARFEVHAFDFDMERIAEVRSELQAIFDGADGEEGVSLPLEDPSAAGEGAQEESSEEGSAGAEPDASAEAPEATEEEVPASSDA